MSAVGVINSLLIESFHIARADDFGLLRKAKTSYRVHVTPPLLRAAKKNLMRAFPSSRRRGKVGVVGATA